MQEDNRIPLYGKDWHSKAIQLKQQGYSNRAISREIYGNDNYRNKINRFFKRKDVKVLFPTPDEVFGNSENIYKDYLINPDVKLLYYDIETTLAKSYHFSQWKVDLSHKQKIQESHLLSHAWAWGNGEVQGSILTQKEMLNHDPERLVLEAWSLLDNADIVVAHHGKQFDIKKVNSYFLQYGLPPPSPYKVIDTLQIAKSKFALPFNSLDYISDFLGVQRKLDTGGIDLWIDCDKGKQDALVKMLEYNKGDITTLRQVHQRLIAWDNNGVNVSNYCNSELNEDVMICTHCGSSNVSLVTGKFVATVVRKYNLYKCNNCHANLRDNVLNGCKNGLKRVL